MNAKRFNEILKYCWKRKVYVTPIHFSNTVYIKGKVYAGGKWYIAVDKPSGRTIYNKPVATGNMIGSDTHPEVQEAIERTYEYYYNKLRNATKRVQNKKNKRH